MGDHAIKCACVRARPMRGNRSMNDKNNRMPSFAESVGRNPVGSIQKVYQTGANGRGRPLLRLHYC